MSKFCNIENCKHCENMLKVKYPVGTAVKVKRDYHCKERPLRESDMPTVVGHALNTKSLEHPFIDNILKFSNGCTEPFGNWEIEEIKS